MNTQNGAAGSTEEWDVAIDSNGEAAGEDNQLSRFNNQFNKSESNLTSNLNPMFQLLLKLLSTQSTTQSKETERTRLRIALKSNKLS